MLVGAMPCPRKVRQLGARIPEGSVSNMGGDGDGGFLARSSLLLAVCASTSAAGKRGRRGKGEIRVGMDLRSRDKMMMGNLGRTSGHHRFELRASMHRRVATDAVRA